MIKKTYIVSGFDCAHCASKAEQHIAKHPDVSFVHLDFSSNTLYITFKKDYWSVEKLASVIKEVESDPLEISFKDNEVKKEEPIFNKKMWWILSRFIFSIIVTSLCVFVLGNDSFRYLRFTLYCLLVVLNGYDIAYKVIQHIIHRTNIIDHNLLMIVASFGALVLSILHLSEPSPCFINGNYVMSFDEALEASMILVLFQLGRLVESIATNKSKRAVARAIALRVEEAKVVKGEEIVSINPLEIAVDDVIVVTSGDIIPVDGIIEKGEAYLDTSSLTGEFVPIRVESGQEVLSGYLVKEGTLYIKAQKAYKNSRISTVIRLISEGNERKSKTDVFIAKFAKWYTPIICLTSILVLLIGGLVSKDWEEWTNKALEVLVTGCPCALVISVPLAYFSAIGLASKNRIIIKGSNYLDSLCSLRKVLLDKTGTLTKGVFTVQDVVPNAVSKDELLNALHAAECLSNHPIGKAIVHKVKIDDLRKEQSDFIEYAGKGVSTVYKGHKILAGSASLLKENNIVFEEAKTGLTIVYCALDNKYLGYVTLNDEMKVNTENSIKYLKKHNIKTILVTGDKKNQAIEIQNQLQLSEIYYELFPEDKLNILNKEKEEKLTLAFVGDGINDAPSLVNSDIGIAMGGIGSDLAVENADIIFMNDDLYSVVKTIKIAKIARRTAIFNIAFALVIKLAIMIFAIVNQHLSDTLLMTLAVLSDTGLTVLLVLNSLLILTRKVK